MKLEVKVTTPEAEGYFRVEAPTIPEAFMLIPLKAAEHGLSLLNDGSRVVYEVHTLIELGPSQ